MKREILIILVLLSLDLSLATAQDVFPVEKNNSLAKVKELIEKDPLKQNIKGLNKSKSELLDSIFKFYCDNGSFSGVVLAADQGKVIFHQAYGFSDFENKIPMDTAGVFNIASITKPFTALAIMILQEEGKISFDDKILKFLPDFPSYAKDVTVRHLLTHTSGIIDYENDMHLINQIPVVTPRIVYDSLIHQRRLIMKPGEKYSYSNSGYFLLALIIEKISGMTYKEFIEKKIFKPAGMKNSFILSDSDTTIPGRVNGYVSCWQKNLDDLNCRVPGDGNIYMTASDLFRFAQALDNYSIISRKTIENAYDTTGATFIRKGYKYGLGWIIQHDSTGTIVTHNGGMGGFRCQLWRNLAKHNTLVILSNSTFLAECLGIIPASQDILNDQPFKTGKIPITELFYEKEPLRGFTSAMRTLRREGKNPNTIYSIPEVPINNLGLEYLFMRQKPLCAIELFKFNTEVFPDSWNAWDSLGEALLSVDDNKAAIEAFKKSFELNPNNSNAENRLKKLTSRKSN